MLSMQKALGFTDGDAVLIAAVLTVGSSPGKLAWGAFGQATRNSQTCRACPQAAIWSTSLARGGRAHSQCW